MYIWTFYALWKDGGDAEVDVMGQTYKEALAKAEALLKRGYKRGWRITEHIQRNNGTIFI